MFSKSIFRTPPRVFAEVICGELAGLSEKGAILKTIEELAALLEAALNHRIQRRKIHIVDSIVTSEVEAIFDRNAIKQSLFYWNAYLKISSR